MSKLLCFLLLVTASMAPAAVINLYDWSFNLDNTLYEEYQGAVPADLPSNVDYSGFDWDLGLGEISIDVSGAGLHSSISFFDHEIDEEHNTWWNEYGSTVGTSSTGLSWEIDEVGGDIYDNFEVNSLDNTNGVPVGFEEDVMMAMGWNFNLTALQTATVTFNLSTTAPGSGFYLIHTDPDSEEDPASIYFSSALTINDSPDPIPEPGTLLLLGLGLAVAGLTARKKRA